jgi:hypothetical protein
MRLVTLPMKPGPVVLGDAPVTVSATCLRWRRTVDLAALALPSLRMRAAWPEVEGAVGLAIAVEPLRVATWSLSVWHDEEDLRRFLGSPAHVAAMKAHRRRLSSSASTCWRTECFVLGEAWREAKRRLSHPGDRRVASD